MVIGTRGICPAIYTNSPAEDQSSASEKDKLDKSSCKAGGGGGGGGANGTEIACEYGPMFAGAQYERL